MDAGLYSRTGGTIWTGTVSWTLALAGDHRRGKHVPRGGWNAAFFIG